jgi:hypothetical protein
VVGRGRGTGQVLSTAIVKESRMKILPQLCAAIVTLVGFALLTDGAFAEDPGNSQNTSKSTTPKANGMKGSTTHADKKQKGAGHHPHKGSPSSSETDVSPTREGSFDANNGGTFNWNKASGKKSGAAGNAPADRAMTRDLAPSINSSGPENKISVRKGGAAGKGPADDGTGSTSPAISKNLTVNPPPK